MRTRLIIWDEYHYQYKDLYNYDISKLVFTRKKQENEIFERLSVQGNIKIWGSDLDYITDISDNLPTAAAYLFFLPDDDYTQTPDNAYNNSNAIRLKLNNYNIKKYNTKKNTGDFEVIVYDQYYNFLSSINKEINIYNNINTYTVYADTQLNRKLIFNVGQFSDNPNIGSSWKVLNKYGDYVDIWAREEWTATDDEINFYNGEDGWQLKTGTTNILIRDWTYNYLSPNDISNSILEVTTTNSVGYSINEQMPNSTAFLSDYTFLYQFYDGASEYTYYKVNNNIYYNFKKIEIKKAVNLRELLTYLITINGYLITSNTFNFFDIKNYLTNIYIIPLTNVLLIEENGILRQKSNLSDKGLITFNDILEYLKKYYHIYYYINDNNEFFFVHKTEINYSIPINENDLTLYKNINWSEGNKLIESDTEKQYRYLRREISGLSDFRGVDIFFPNISDIKEYKIKFDKFHHDIGDILLNSKKYNNSNKEFVVFSTDSNTGGNILKCIGVLSGNEILNGYLSLANIDNDIFADGFDKQAQINNIPITLNSNQYERYKNLSVIETVIKDYKNNFDFKQFVKTDYSSDGIIDEINVKAGSTKCTIKIKV